MKTDTIATISLGISAVTMASLLGIAATIKMLANKGVETMDVVQKYAPKVPKFGGQKGESEVDQMCRVTKEVCAFKKEMNVAMNTIKKIW